MATVHELRITPRPKASRRWPTKRLTDAVLNSIKPGERVYDEGSPGFYALGGKGVVSFVVQADTPRAVKGLPSTMVRVIGTWSDVTTVKVARRTATDWLGKIKSGIDPKPKVRVAQPDDGAPETWTLQMAWDNYMRKVERDGASVSSIRTYKANYACMKRHKPKWPERPIKEIIQDGNGLRSLHDAIHAGKRENFANSAVKTLARVARYAHGKSDGKLPVWNNDAVDFFRLVRRNDKGMGLDEVGTWWEGVTRDIKNPIRRELALFMLLTGLRTGDATTALESNLDETKKTIFIPSPKGENPKRGARRAFTLPLSDAALACILRARALKHKPSKFLFPNERTGKPFRDAQLDEHKGGHALRNSFETIGEDIGIEVPVIGRLMNHVAKTQTGAYGHPDKIIASPREAMNRISDAIMAKVNL